MFTVDTITIVISITLLVTAIVTAMVNIFFRSVKAAKENGNERMSEEKGFPYPSVSVLLTIHDNARQLESHLPIFLSQDYPSAYEVIVVVDKCEDDTDDVLKQFSSRYPNLYVTFIPDSSRYMSRHKLAITLGVKAAKNNWILLTEAECYPISDQWLKTMARNCDEHTDMVMGYANYSGDSSDYHRFEHLHSSLYMLRHAQRGTAYGCKQGNLMFRKKMFMEGRGFEGNLKFVRGEYDFIVNKYAQRHNTAIEVHPDAWIKIEALGKREWNNQHLYYMETRKHLKRSFGHRVLFHTDMTLLHFNYLLIVAAFVYAPILSAIHLETIHAWIVAASAFMSLILTLVLRLVFAQKTIRRFHAEIPMWKSILFEWVLVWKNIGYKLKYRFADKYDFISHKI